MEEEIFQAEERRQEEEILRDFLAFAELEGAEMSYDVGMIDADSISREQASDLIKRFLSERMGT